MSTERSEGVVFAIKENRRNRILTEIRTKPGGTYYGRLILPAETSEPGETSVETLKRGLLEECEIKAKNYTNLGVFNIRRPDGRFNKLTLFLVSGYKGKIYNKEIAKGFQLFLPLNTIKRLVYEGSLEMVRAVEASLSTRQDN